MSALGPSCPLVFHCGHGHPVPFKNDCLFDQMLNHEKSDRIAVPTVEINTEKNFNNNFAEKLMFFCGKTMYSNFLQLDLRGDIYMILKVVIFQSRNEMLVSFDKKCLHSKLRIYTQSSRSGIEK